MSAPDPVAFHRLATNPRVLTGSFFLGHYLHVFAARRQWDDATLAAWLACEVATLDHLRLCRSLHTDADYDLVATKFGVSAERLREVMQG
ncbi:hypothetical protein VT84_13975 [Gemmata sp. SH-PL17]|uniref:hypothetical protein n=1 Tax=Gemmata sp. SH-PL17 TaxID=1630693 RepID=UPI00078E4F7C|nr:hypothetical protein [Gemmata sp. SH-PL17]AMV25502.1 hypothetical protein VT84_13975 [Gemmata sp. SH-PL17]